MWVCVCSFLAFYESLFALWGGKSKRGERVSVLVETDCCVCVFKDNAIITPTPGELKSPRHMHTLLLSLSQLILCSGHTFPIVLLTTRQLQIFPLSLCLAQTRTHSVVWHERERAFVSWLRVELASWIFSGYSIWGGAELFLCCCFVNFGLDYCLLPFQSCSPDSRCLFFWILFRFGSLCFCGLLKIVSDMHGSFVDV